MSRPKVYERCDSKFFTNIPKELKEPMQWVVWKSLQRENDTGKVPCVAAPGTREAKSNDPTTWRTFGEVVAYFKKDKELHGIGFMFSPHDPFAGIDLDDCRDPITEELTDYARELLKLFNSYSEISPSGTGIKIIIRGEVPGRRKRKRGGVEMYSHGRYFTITGQHVKGTPETIEYRQGQLADLYTQIFGHDPAEEEPEPIKSEALEIVRKISDDDLLEFAMRSRPFRELWEGSIAGFGSHSDADFALCCKLAFWTHGDIPRIERLFEKSGLIRPKWKSNSGAITYRMRTIVAACSAEKNRYDPTKVSDTVPIRNDSTNTKIFIDVCGNEFLYIAKWAEWIRWDGNCWQRNAKDKFHCEAADRVSHELMRLASSASEDERKKAFAWAVKAGGAGAATAMEGFARAQLEIKPEILDAETMVLACGNGVIDLRTGELRAGRPSDYQTRSTPVEFEPDALCPRFDKFLHEIMLGDADMVAYLWRVLGYCLTGETTEEKFFILHGNGLNGKSTLIELIYALMGDLAQSARFQTFLSKGPQASGPNDDIAHMAGARVVVALEADEAAKLDSAIVKNITGGDSIRARFLYGKEFQFKPHLKLFLVSNYIPKIDDTSHAIWRRVHYIPFLYQVPDDKVDGGLPLKLYGELEGILAKAVRACLEWQEVGLKPPAEVVEATRKLREESDTLGCALEELTIRDPLARVKHSDLLDSVAAHYTQNKYKIVPRSAQLIKDLRRRGFVDKRGGANVLYWHGIGLRSKVYMEDMLLSNDI